MREIARPSDLAAAWLADEVSPWDAIVILLHHVDRTNAMEWVEALPADLRAHVREDDDQFVPGKPTVSVGKGRGLEPRPSARAALHDALTRCVEGT